MRSGVAGVARPSRSLNSIRIARRKPAAVLSVGSAATSLHEPGVERMLRDISSGRGSGTVNTPLRARRTASNGMPSILWRIERSERCGMPFRRAGWCGQSTVNGAGSNAGHTRITLIIHVRWSWHGCVADATRRFTRGFGNAAQDNCGSRRKRRKDSGNGK